MSQPQRFFEFDNFLLDSQQRLLFRDGQPLDLTPKVFDVLFELVQSGGRVIEKKELMEKIWPDSFVEEANLTQHVSTLRKKLGQDASHQRYILTVPGRGYRFVAPIRSWDDDAIVTVRERVRSRVTIGDASHEVSLPEIEVVDSPPKLLSAAATRRRRGKGILILLAGAVVLGVGLLILFKLRNSLAPPPFTKFKLTRFTTDGKIDCAAISSDGKSVAYVIADRGQSSLWIRQVSTANPGVLVIPPSGRNYVGLAFSPDNDYIYFVGGPLNSPSTLYRVPALGGKAVPLVDDVDSAPGFSPDGKKMAYLRGYPDAAESVVLLSDINGSNETKLSSLKGQELQFNLGPGIAWSPDGAMIATSIIVADGSGQHQEVCTIDARTGEIKILTNNRWARVVRVAWSAGGRSLVTTAAESDATSQVWYIGYPSGEARRITNDLSDYRGLTAAAASQTVAVVQFDQRSNVWVAGNDGAGAVQVTANNYDGFDGLAWTPDDRLLYTSTRNGAEDLWISDSDGKSSTQLTQNAGRNIWPDIASDGKTVVFCSTRDGSEHIWKMDAEGNHQQRLTGDVRDNRPVISPDGQWVVYRSAAFATPNLRKVPAQGGSFTELTTEGLAGAPTISPDGKTLAFFYRQKALAGAKIALLPFDLSAPINVLDTKVAANRFVIHWTNDGQSIAYIKTNEGVSNIWLQPINGDPPRQLTNFDSQLIYSFAFSRNGRLAVTRGQEISDVVLISSVQ